MDRILGANTIDLGGGRRGFRGKDTVAGIAGTELTAVWHNAVQEEIVGAAEAVALVPDAGDLKQLFRAMRQLGGQYFVAAGTANALTIAIPLPFANNAQMIGVPIRVKINLNNTAAATLNTLPIVRQDGDPLRRNDLVAGDIREMFFDGTSFRLFSLVPPTERSLTVFASAQSLPNAVETGVVFATPAVGADPLGFFSAGAPGRFTIPSGVTKVKVSGVCAFAANNTGFRQVRLLQNGGAITAGGRVDVQLPTAANICPLNITGFSIPVAAGDWFTMLGLQNSGGSLALDAPSTSFTIEY